MTLKKVHIWNPETGITGIDESFLNQDDVCASLAQEWAELRNVQGESAPFIKILEQRDREWAIETGIIEGAYRINKGTTTILIEHGFQENLIQHGTTDLSPAEIIERLNNHKNALEIVYDFVKHNRQISTSFIKEIHAILMRSEETTVARDNQGKLGNVTLVKGEWKKQDNVVRKDNEIFYYCPVEQTASEMDRLVEMLNDYQTRNISPCIIAAWFHHRFTQIHPFQDGNGRVIRALCTAILVKAGLFYFNVKQEFYVDYIKALEAADKHDIEDLLEVFIKQQRDILLDVKIEAEKAKVNNVNNLDKSILNFKNRIEINKKILMLLDELKEFELRLENSFEINLVSLKEKMNKDLIQLIAIQNIKDFKDFNINYNNGIVYKIEKPNDCKIYILSSIDNNYKNSKIHIYPYPYFSELTTQVRNSFEFSFHYSDDSEKLKNLFKLWIVNNTASILSSALSEK